jgi:hypothetical protein
VAPLGATQRPRAGAECERDGDPGGDQPPPRGHRGARCRRRGVAGRPQRGERIAHLGRRGEPLVRPLGERAMDDAFELGRNVGAQLS